MSERTRIFSGEYSVPMWQRINSAKRKRDLRAALYHVCCRLQELEAELERTRALRYIPDSPVAEMEASK